MPWSEEEAEKIAEEWFQIWLDARGGTGNLEVEKAIKAIQEDWELYKENHYHNLDKGGDRSGSPREPHRYYRRLNGELEVYIKAEIFTRLVGLANRKELFDTMKKRGMLIMTKEGTRKENSRLAGRMSESSMVARKTRCFDGGV